MPPLYWLPPLAEPHANKLLRQGQVLLVVCPQRLTLTDRLQPQRQTKVPIDSFVSSYDYLP